MNTKDITYQMIKAMESINHNKIVFKKLERNVWAWVYHHEDGRKPKKNIIEKIEIDHSKGELLETVVHEFFHILCPDLSDSRINSLEIEWVKKSSWKEKQEILLCFLNKTTKKYGRQISSRKKSA